MAKTFVLVLALFIVFFSLAAASTHHHKHAQPTSTLWLVRKLWSHFTFSSAHLGDSSLPMEAYRRSSRSGKKTEVNNFHSPRRENSWWSSIAASVPTALPGPVIALDPTSLVAADSDDMQRMLQNPHGAELDVDISDAVPVSAVVEDPMHAVPPKSPAKPSLTRLHPLLKTRPFGLKDPNAVGRFAPGYGGFTAASGPALSEPIWTSFGFNYAGQETARTQSVMKVRPLEREASSAADEHDGIEVADGGGLPAGAENNGFQP